MHQHLAFRFAPQDGYQQGFQRQIGVHLRLHRSASYLP
jgi:hypothetical protein